MIFKQWTNAGWGVVGSLEIKDKQMANVQTTSGDYFTGGFRTFAIS